MKNISITLAVIILSLTFQSSCNKSTDTCVSEGTLITTPSGTKLVEHLQIGDIVLSPDPLTNQIHTGRVTSIRSSVRECLLFSLEDGGTLRVTSEHPLWDPISMTFKSAGEFVPFNIVSHSDVQSGDISSARIVAIAEQGVMSRVYDLTINSKPHTFIANGVVVHNKIPPPDPAPSPVNDLVIELVDSSTVRAIWTEPGSATDGLSLALFFVDTLTVSDSTVFGGIEISLDLMGAMGGSVDTAMLSGLGSATTYNVRMRVARPTSEFSELSNSVNFTTGP